MIHCKQLIFDKASNRLTRTLVFALLLPATVGLVGCGSNLAGVSGTVTLDGVPLNTGRVTFQGASMPMAYGEIDSSGHYTLSTGDKRGIAPGEYSVAVASYEMGEITGRGNPPSAKLITPAKYANLQTTDLRADVERGRNSFDFDLKRE